MHNLIREITSESRLGGGEGSALESITYEVYGVDDVAVMVECMTANRNRTASDGRHGFTKFGGSLVISSSRPIISFCCA